MKYIFHFEEDQHKEGKTVFPLSLNSLLSLDHIKFFPVSSRTLPLRFTMR